MRAIRKIGRRGFDNEKFWNHRYLTNPLLGSGIGSRGELAMIKRRLVIDAWIQSGYGSILDIGFGDLQVLDPSEFPAYVGIDISEIAVLNARERYPQRTFLKIDFGGEDEPEVPEADLILCLDVLIHQSDLGAYRRVVSRLVSRTRQTGLVSGFEAPSGSSYVSDITFYHEPLSRTLSNARATEIRKVLEYRGLDVLQFRRGAFLNGTAEDGN